MGSGFIRLSGNDGFQKFRYPVLCFFLLYRKEDFLQGYPGADAGQKAVEPVSAPAEEGDASAWTTQAYRKKTFSAVYGCKQACDVLCAAISSCLQHGGIFHIRAMEVQVLQGVPKRGGIVSVRGLPENGESGDCGTPGSRTGAVIY